MWKYWSQLIIFHYFFHSPKKLFTYFHSFLILVSNNSINIYWTNAWIHNDHFEREKSFICAAAAKSPQSCPTLCDPRDGSPPGSPVPGILQARTLEWVAISFSNAWKWKVKEKSFSVVRLLVTPWTAAHQAPLSMRFSRQEHWSGVPLPSFICAEICSKRY